MANVTRRGFMSLFAAPVASAGPRMATSQKSPQAHRFKDDGTFPNSRYPALVYTGLLGKGDELAIRFERLFAKNGWSASWRNGLYRVHHYHSVAHEVLGVYSGSVKVRLGGEGGLLVTLRAGDVAVLPAGVAHKNEEQSPDFRVVGAYAHGISPDLNYGKAGERPGTDKNIAAVRLPETDPLQGKDGALRKLWRA